MAVAAAVVIVRIFRMKLKQENRLSSICCTPKYVQILQIKTDNVQNGTFQVSSEGDSGSEKIRKHRAEYIDSDAV